jgi:hypothetical protein
MPEGEDLGVAAIERTGGVWMNARRRQRGRRSAFLARALLNPEA